jgi:hypothetical protein
MSDQPQVAQPLPTSHEASVLVRRIALIALLSVALGFGIQGLILAVRIAGGQSVGAVGVALTLAQGVTWSVLVCIGVGIATSISKARPMLAGLMSFLVAPLALAIAKSVQKMVAGLLTAVEQQAALSLSFASSVKALEYGLLGWLLARLAQRGELSAASYFGTGAAIGAFFGGTVAWLSYQAAIAKGMQMGPAQIGASLINEVVFPVGCALVVYAAQLVARSAKLMETQKAPAL